MPKIQVDWISFGISVVLPFVISVYFFFAFRRQRKQLKRLQNKEWTTLTELNAKERRIGRVQSVVWVLLFMATACLIFSLIMTAKYFKFF